MLGPQGDDTMFEIKGKMATAVCYATVVEDKAIEQIRALCDSPCAEGSRIRIMPDVHSGKGCTIGTTMTIRDRVVPNLVGVDIGCGMYTIDIGQELPDLESVDEAAHYIPSSQDVWDNCREHFDLTDLRCFPKLTHPGRLERSLGTLGGGNHFIEIDAAENGTKYLVIHSGSRNLGKQVAEYYQRLAIDLANGKEEYAVRRNALIESYKAAGRQAEIESALNEMRLSETEPTGMEGLSFLSGQYLEDYLHDVRICQHFAWRNRELMAEILLDRAGISAKEAFHTVHNYIDTDEMVLRKGAIAAHMGEKVLIPINMRDGSILAVGRGNPEWNWSAPHGAGRLMSRTAAREQLSLEEYRQAMAGIYTTSVSSGTLDEAPMAYKSLSDILDVVTESVDVIEVLKPIYNFKAS